MNEPTKITVDYLLQNPRGERPLSDAELAEGERILTEWFGPPPYPRRRHRRLFDPRRLTDRLRTPPEPPTPFVPRGTVMFDPNPSTDDLYPRRD